MSKIRIRVKTRSKWQSKLNREIKNFNYSIKNRESLERQKLIKQRAIDRKINECNLEMEMLRKQFMNVMLDSEV